MMANEKMIECDICNGNGYEDSYCGNCNGSGEGPADGTHCQVCKGSGNERSGCIKCAGSGEITSLED